MVGQDKKTVCCLCCQRGPIGLRCTLERTAYVCGEHIRLHAHVENQMDQDAAIKIKLIQHVEYFINKGVLGVTKRMSFNVLEHKSPKVSAFSHGKYDSTLEQPIQLPVVPPTLIGVCRLIQVYYILKVCLDLEKSGEDLTMEFPFTVATVPFRIPHSRTQPDVEYDFCSSHVEGGMYISPEFQLGQVYDGTVSDEDNVVLYRPVYLRIPKGEPSKTIPTVNSANLEQPDGIPAAMASEPQWKEEEQFATDKASLLPITSIKEPLAHPHASHMSANVRLSLPLTHRPPKSTGGNTGKELNHQLVTVDLHHVQMTSDTE